MKNSKLNRGYLFLMRLILLIIVLVFFFILLSIFSPTTIEFPSVVVIFIDFLKSLIDITVVKAMSYTAFYVLISILVSILIGVILSILLTAKKKVWKICEPTIDFFRSVPVTFFIPAFAVVLGSNSPHIIWVLAVIPSTLIIIINLSYGIAELEKSEKKNRLHQYHLLSGNYKKISALRKITIYEILPYFITGFKIALSYTIIIVTVLEYLLLGDEIGLGRLVNDEMEAYNYERVYSIIIIVGLIGLGSNYLIDKILRKYER